MDLGRSWAPFGWGLGRSGPSFGHFWTLFGNFLEVLNPFFFKHRSRMGSRRPFGWILDRFWKVWEGFWKGLGTILTDFSTFLQIWGRFGTFLKIFSLAGKFSKDFLCQDPRVVSRSPAERPNFFLSQKGYGNEEPDSFGARWRAGQQIRSKELVLFSTN